MKLRDLVAGIAQFERSPLAEALEITSITDDSRHAGPGCLFVARPGTKTDGRAFIADAVARGAAAVLFDDSDGSADPCPPGSTVVRVRVNSRGSGGRAAASAGAAGVAAAVVAAAGATQANAGPSAINLAACRLAERLEGDPSEWLRVVGITGTNGKTTIAFLVQQLVRAAAPAGDPGCGLIGTVLVDDGHEAKPADLTTPSGIQISAAMGRMVRNRCTACAMEVSSHALDQGRASAVRFRAGVFTNLTGDHLDYHGTMEAYAAAKAKLFTMLPADGTAVVNADDPWHAAMLAQCRARVLRCSVREGTADAEAGTLPSADWCVATIHEAKLGWQDVTLAGPWGKPRLKLPLVGRHNAMNALQAAAAAHSIGVPAAALVQALAACKAPPGRLEPVTTPDDPFAVLVDYAHTDDALLNVLTALRPLVGKGGRLITVFGCGGDRDRTKRPRMMRVACMHSDRVVVTSDNPRTEEPESIMDQVVAGRPEGAELRATSVQRQVDRARAIELAVQEARAGDIVLVAGKGHEDYQIIGTEKRPFDDRLVALAALGRQPQVASTRVAAGSAA